MKDKKSLRAYYKRLREEKSESFRKSASNAIFQRLTSNPAVKTAKTIMSYISMGSEPDTVNFINHMINGDKKVAVPVVFGREMEASYISSLSGLNKSSFGVLEPSGSLFHKCNPGDIDVIIVPALAFDTKGYRIGYGGGYYDKFLPKTSGLKIGICFDFSITCDIRPQPHDVAVDYIITDLREFI